MAIIRSVAAVSTAAVLVSFAALLYKPVTLRLEVLGLTRAWGKIRNIHGEDFRIIPDTLYCEDLHYHEPSGLLFGASEEKPETRAQWFPPFVIPSIHRSCLVTSFCNCLKICSDLYYVAVWPNSMIRMHWIEVLLLSWILRYIDTSKRFLYFSWAA